MKNVVCHLIMIGILVLPLDLESSNMAAMVNEMEDGQNLFVFWCFVSFHLFFCGDSIYPDEYSPLCRLVSVNNFR